MIISPLGKGEAESSNLSSSTISSQEKSITGALMKEVFAVEARIEKSIYNDRPHIHFLK